MTSMEIYFCDLCNESVPQADLDASRAFLRKGRAVCAACDRAMGGGIGGGGESSIGLALHAEGGGGTALQAPPRTEVDPSAPRGTSHAAISTRQAAAKAQAGSSGGPVALLAIVALIFTAGSFAVISLRMRETEVLRADERRTAATQLAGLEARMGEMFGRMQVRLDASQTQNTAALAALRQEIGDRLSGFERELSGLRGEASDLSQDLSDLSTKVGLDKKDTERVLDRISATQQSTTMAVNEFQLSMDQRLIVVEEYQRASLSGVGPVGMGAGGAPAGAPNQPTWHGLLPDLKHEHEGIRLEAVYALGETGDRAVVPHLSPLLEDDNLFVRMATIQTLKNLNARQTVPALIDALEDEESAVREAAMLALHQLTNREFRFEPLASIAERAKRVKAWRDWWKKNGEVFLEG
ncbi:MAG: hypothetical protein ACI841_005098 [Planctomycetota bacterium]|jgi:hypothetical protein